jgi:hypothetical protein
MREGWTVVEAQADDPIYQQGGVFGIGITHPKQTPQPIISYEPLTPELQIKYNGTKEALTVIKYEDLRIYKHLVPEEDINFTNACVLDANKKLSQDELNTLSELDVQNRYSLFFLGQKYGLDIFNPVRERMSGEEFKQRCIHLAEVLSVQHNIPVRVVFAQTLLPTIIDVTPKTKG